MEKRLTRSMPDRSLVEAIVEIRDGSTGLSAGFAVSGHVWLPRGTHSGAARRHQGRDCDAAGQIVDELAAAFPELAPIMDVHLADLDGVPMHAVANGWYLYSGKSRAYELENYGPTYVDRLGTDHERAAAALHTSPWYLPEGMTKEEFEAFADGLRPRWAEQAQLARAAFDAL